MTEAASMFSEEHVRRYRKTNGEVGPIWQGSIVERLLEMTTRRR